MKELNNTENIMTLRLKEKANDQERRIISVDFTKSAGIKDELLVDADSIAGIINREMKKILTARKADRRIRANHRSVTGWLQDRENSQVQHESMLERDFCQLALFCENVEDLYSQPLTITGEDQLGQSRSYTPDFLLGYKTSKSDISHALVEVKYTEELKGADTGLLERLEIGKNWAAENNHAFYIFTEKEIRGVALQNIAAIMPFKYYDDDLELQWRLREEVVSKNGISINELLYLFTSNGEQKAIVQRELWICLARRLLYFNVSENLTPSTRLFDEPVWDDESLFFN